MDEARALLDSLMGQSRDQSLDEAKQMKGKNFTRDNVCKFHLLGFCPQYELSFGKMAKRNIGDCDKAHSDAMKEEYEQHSEKDKYQKQYEKELLPVLERCVREADAWVARERANVQRSEATAKQKAEKPPSLPQNVQDELDQLNADVGKLMAAAEERAEEGDIDGSKFKVMLAEEIKNKVKEIESRHKVPSYWCSDMPSEEVCEVCGTRIEAATVTNHARYAAHFTGKVHVGYLKIRQWVKNLRKKDREAEGRSRGDRGDGDRKGQRSRSNRRGREERGRRSRSPREERRRRSRSRRRDEEKRNCSPSAEKHPRREQQRSRDRGEGDRAVGGRRERSRSKDRRR